MTKLNQGRGLSAHEAVLVLGIHRFARDRAQHGELVSLLAANKIAAMARIVGIHAKRPPSELSLRVGDTWWTTELLRSAAAIIERDRCHALLLRLDTLLQDLRVGDVEGYEEPDCVPTQEHTEPESTGVHVVDREDFEAKRRDFSVIAVAIQRNLVARQSVARQSAGGHLTVNDVETILRTARDQGLQAPVDLHVLGFQTFSFLVVALSPAGVREYLAQVRRDRSVHLVDKLCAAVPGIGTADRYR